MVDSVDKIFNNNEPLPKDPKWMDTWDKQVIFTKVFTTIIFTLFALMMIAGVILLIAVNDKPAIGIILALVAMVGLIIITPIWINTLTHCKVRKYVIDGYNVLIYSNLFYSLVVEGVSQCSSSLSGNVGTTCFLSGKLPNGKRIMTPIVGNDGAINLDIQIVEE